MNHQFSDYINIFDDLQATEESYQFTFGNVSDYNSKTVEFWSSVFPFLIKNVICTGRRVSAMCALWLHSI